MNSVENFNAVRNLNERILSNIQIPQELRNNMRVSISNLNGCYLDYRSNSKNDLTQFNSTVKLSLMFSTADNGGYYIGEAVGLKIIEGKGLKAPRGIKTKVHYTQVVTKVNKWIVDNKDFLFNSIENK